jgi:hypothetical protein
MYQYGLQNVMAACADGRAWASPGHHTEFAQPCRFLLRNGTRWMLMVWAWRVYFGSSGAWRLEGGQDDTSE